VNPGRRHPIIFASSLLYLPSWWRAIAGNPRSPTSSQRYLSSTTFSRRHGADLFADHLLRVLYTSITFNRPDVAET
jgi:preprotein translocase subunit SecY